MAHRTCSVEDCERKAHARLLCVMHYARWAKHGDPTVVATLRRDDVTLEWFMARVDVNDASGCWVWNGHIANHGYGKIGLTYAHRLSYEHFVGSIPEGLHVDHLCRTRACCNPAHLEPVTPAENTRRGHGHGAETHCPQGHPYSGDNLLLPSRGGRQCRACKRERDRKRYRRLKGGTDR